MKKIGKSSEIYKFLLLTLTCIFIISSCSSVKEEKIEKDEDYELNQDVSEWIHEGRKNKTIESSCLQIKSKAKQGTFNIYIKDHDEGTVPVFSTAEEFTGTSFFLQAGKKIYRLSGGSGIISGTRETENGGLQIAYVIPKVAYVLVDFKIISSFDKKEGDMIKMTSVVKNLKNRKEIFALKLVMDTAIGEKSRYHFYGSNNEPVETEILYSSSRDNEWFITGNDLASFQVLLTGADVSNPDFVAVANHETLDTLNWEPAVLSSRAFDTVSSYNNSACCVSWKKQALETEEKFNRIIYFAVAAYPESLTSDRFFENYKYPVKAKNQAEIIKADGESSFKSEKTPGVKEYVSSEGSYSEDYSLYDLLQDFDKESDENDESQFSADYIRRLLNRIAELETSGKELNEEELLLLNAEIDEILLHLKENR